MIDGARPVPDDLVQPPGGAVVGGATHRVAARSVVVLFVQPPGRSTGP